MKRLLGVVALVTGLAMVIGPIAGSTFSRAAAGERLLRDAEGSVGKQGIVRFRADLEALKAASKDLTTTAFADFQNAFSLDDQELRSVLDTRYPALSLAVFQRGQEIVGSIERGVSNLEAHQSDFEAAKDIPLPGVPSTVLPWFAILTGLCLIGLGGWSLRGGRPAVLAIGAVGALLVTSTLAMNMPAKSAQLEDLVGSLDISRGVADRTREQFDIASAGVTALGPFFRDLAQGAGVSETQLTQRVLPTRYPKLAALLADDASLRRIEGEVIFRETHVEDFAKVKNVPYVAVTWSFIALGGLLVLLAALATLRDRRGATATDGAGTTPGVATSAPSEPSRGVGGISFGTEPAVDADRSPAGASPLTDPRGTEALVPEARVTPQVPGTGGAQDA